MIKQRNLGIAVLWFLSATAGMAQSEWAISDDFSIEFEGTGAEGNFSGLEGTIRFDPRDLASASINVTIDPATISTGNKTKDKHARGSSWFDVKEYVKIGFVSETISRTDQGYQAIGHLTMHGVSKKITIDFTFEREGDSKGLFLGRLKVNRKDFGIEGPLLSFMVGEEFEVSLRVPVSAM